MISKGRLAAMLIAFTFFGCKGLVQTTAASSGEGIGSGGTITQNITDPTMNNITAFYVKIPATWKFQGVLMQGGAATCDSYAMLSWRATSSDGASKMEQMPQMLWVYGNGPKPHSGCLPIDSPMSATDFLQHLATMMQLGPVTNVPVADENAKVQEQYREADAKAAAFYASRNLPQPKNTVEIAAGDIQYTKGSVAYRGRLKGMVHCTENTRPGMRSMLQGMPSTPAITTGKCTADVTYLSAPASQFAVLVRQWDSPSMGPAQNHEWGDAWVKRYAQQGDIMNSTLIHQQDEKFAAQRQEIAHTMAVQQEVHDQFLATMQRGTDISMARAQDSMNARSTAASDMVDFSLDRQTVLNTNTGAIYKITNQVTVGGALVQVHGNGMP